MNLRRTGRGAECLIFFCVFWLAIVSSAATSANVAKGQDAPILGIIFPDDEEDDAWVMEVTEDGPAAKAGVKAGDTITKFNKEDIKTIKRLRELMKQQKPGDVVKLTVRRSAESLVLSVKLGKRGN